MGTHTDADNLGHASRLPVGEADAKKRLAPTLATSNETADLRVNDGVQ
jgi:hypothetical protein